MFKSGLPAEGLATGAPLAAALCASLPSGRRRHSGRVGATSRAPMPIWNTEMDFWAVNVARLRR